jgi:hypothetical protein
LTPWLDPAAAWQLMPVHASVAQLKRQTLAPIEHQQQRSVAWTSALSPAEDSAADCRSRGSPTQSSSPGRPRPSRSDASAFVNAEVSGGSHEVPDLLKRGSVWLSLPLFAREQERGSQRAGRAAALAAVACCEVRAARLSLSTHVRARQQIAEVVNAAVSKTGFGSFRSDEGSNPSPSAGRSERSA